MYKNYLENFPKKLQIFRNTLEIINDLRNYSKEFHNLQKLSKY